MMTIDVARFRGRFAPSPSGPLHFGSLVAAVGSYLQAKSHGGEWLLRIEDIDTTRVQPGAASHILRTLEQFGLYWDQTESYQTERLPLYQAVFEQLYKEQKMYACDCNRARIQHLGGIYDGFCQQRLLGNTPNDQPLAWRLVPGEVPTSFIDLVFGQVEIPQAVCREHYTIKRRDGLFAYQFVVVIDDLQQQIGQVIRGADLLDMTTRQQTLCHLLGLAAPEYGHLPLAVTAPGQNLSKQNHATDIRSQPLAQSLQQALNLLGHRVPSELQGADVRELLCWALGNWQLNQVPKTTEVQIALR